jgi:hypothetical protein
MLDACGRCAPKTLGTTAALRYFQRRPVQLLGRRQRRSAVGGDQSLSETACAATDRTAKSHAPSVEIATASRTATLFERPAESKEPRQLAHERAVNCLLPSSGVRSCSEVALQDLISRSPRLVGLSVVVVRRGHRCSLLRAEPDHLLAAVQPGGVVDDQVGDVVARSTVEDVALVVVR